MKHQGAITQFIKFGVVGIFNTIITAIVIWLLLDIAHLNDFISNLSGYIVGLINSFIWNRCWTFASKSKIGYSAIKFLVSFLFCYVIQWGIVLLLTNISDINTYYCHLFGMVIYTIMNFLINKYYTFKSLENE